MFDSIMIVIGLLILLPIGFAFFYDYKADPKSFIAPLKSISKKIAIVLVIYLLSVVANKIYEYYIPLNANYGIEYNAERGIRKIPLLPSEWKISKENSSQFEKHWLNPNYHNRHFKKVIQYSFSDIKSETDYYKNEHLPDVIAWSTYNFENNDLKYFIEKPSQQIVSQNKNGEFKYNKTTRISEISREGFGGFVK